jgi:hypothetical protein
MNSRPLFVLLLCFIFLSGLSQSRHIASFSISPEKDIPPQPISLDINGLDYNEADLLVVSTDGRAQKLPSQFMAGTSPRLWFNPGQVLEAGENYNFKIYGEDTPAIADRILARKDRDHITLLAGDQEVLKYRHSMIEAPEGTNPLYRRQGAYIHPLFSPSGKILTEIQPEDHYHHYGIWNPWTRTIFEGRPVDFWNLAEGQGTVRHAGTLAIWSGPLCGGFRVYHEHVDYTAPGADKTALNETWDIRVWSTEIDNRPVSVIDYVFTLNCATDSAVLLSAYRYGGGLGFRGTDAWTRYNSTVLTSEGKTRKDADATNARWCMMEGSIGEGIRSGVVIMSHPANRAHPEPMRVWPESEAGGIGYLFFEFCPIRHQEWQLLPGREYVLQYRMIVFDGNLDTDQIESYWHHFAYPPIVSISKPE